MIEIIRAVRSIIPAMELTFHSPICIYTQRFILDSYWQLVPNEEVQRCKYVLLLNEFDLVRSYCRGAEYQAMFLILNMSLLVSLV